MGDELNQVELQVAHELGHDVPGFISGELLGGLDPLSAAAVAGRLRAAVKLIVALRGRETQLDDALEPFVDAYKGYIESPNVSGPHNRVSLAAFEYAARVFSAPDPGWLSTRDTEIRLAGYRVGIVDAAEKAESMKALDVAQSIRALVGNGIDEVERHDKEARRKTLEDAAGRVCELAAGNSDSFFRLAIALISKNIRKWAAELSAPPGSVQADCTEANRLQRDPD
jgi:hypothetical protein